MWWPLAIPLCFLARVVLFVMGWEFVHPSMFDHADRYKRIVLIFSHTSYTDFYMLALYLLAYPGRLNHVRTLIKPQPFRYAGFILRYLGAIPATSVNDKNGGAVDRIIVELKQQPRWLFLISPKGSILKREWRSGYYYIAKKFRAKLMVVGLDYEMKRIVLSKEVSSELDETTVRQSLQEELKKIVPLYPEEEIVPIRSHDPTKRSIIHVSRVITILGFLSLITLYWFS